MIDAVVLGAGPAGVLATLRAADLNALPNAGGRTDEHADASLSLVLRDLHDLADRAHRMAT